MREMVFLVRPGPEGRWLAICGDPLLHLCAPTIEELHHEAREALIGRLGPAHVACRIRLRRQTQDGAGSPPLPLAGLVASAGCC
jgi:hypothetical protein